MHAFFVLRILASSFLVGPEVEQHPLPLTAIVGVDYPYDLAVPGGRLAPSAATAARRRRRVEGGGPDSAL